MVTSGPDVPSVEAQALASVRLHSLPFFGFIFRAEFGGGAFPPR
jgi:hypothetical protein